MEKTGRMCFWGETKCEKCAAPYLLYKMITGELLDGIRLTHNEWKDKLEELNI